MDISFAALMHALGLDSAIPLMLAVHALASALDALIPQPAAGSHWIPVRKLLSIIAGNMGNAANASQPSMLSWVQRVAGLLVSILPPPGAAAVVAEAATRVAPVVSPVTTAPVQSPIAVIAPDPMFPFPAQK